MYEFDVRQTRYSPTEVYTKKSEIIDFKFELKRAQLENACMGNGLYLLDEDLLRWLLEECRYHAEDFFPFSTKKKSNPEWTGARSLKGKIEKLLPENLV